MEELSLSKLLEDNGVLEKEFAIQKLETEYRGKKSFIPTTIFRIKHNPTKIFNSREDACQEYIKQNGLNWSFVENFVNEYSKKFDKDTVKLEKGKDDNFLYSNGGYQIGFKVIDSKVDEIFTYRGSLVSCDKFMQLLCYLHYNRIIINDLEVE